MEHYSNPKKRRVDSSRNEIEADNTNNNNVLQDECEAFAMNCFLCQQVFTDIDELQEHLSVHSLEPSDQNITTQQYFNCNVCERSLRSKKELKKHYKYYHESNMLRRVKEASEGFQCEHCNNIYIAEKYLKIHMELEHGLKEAKSIEATDCSEKFYVAIQITEKKQKYPPRSPYCNPNLWIYPDGHC